MTDSHWDHLPAEGERVRVTYESNQPDAGEQEKVGMVTSVLRVERGKFWIDPVDDTHTLEIETGGRERIFSMSPSRTTPIGTVTDIEVIEVDAS